MNQSKQVQNPYANRYDSISEAEGTPSSTAEYDHFGSDFDSSDPTQENDAAEDLQRFQAGQGDRPSDAEIFSDLDPDFFADESQSEANFNADESLKKLAGKIQDSAILSDEEKASLLEEVAELQQEHLEGSIDIIDLEYEVEALQDKLGMTKDEAKSNQKIATDQLKKDLTDLTKTELENHRISGATKETFESEVAKLETLLSEPNPDLEQIEGKINSLKKEISEAIKTEELKEGLTQVSNKIPKSGVYWKVTQELATKVDEAMENGNWTEVRAFLVDHQNKGESNNKRRKRFERRIERRTNRKGDDKDFRDRLEWEFSHKAVQQYVGTLLHKVGEGNETKLDALLSLIPKDVINTMIGALEYAKHDLNDTQFAKDDAAKQINGYYGTVAETAERLREHLEWNPEGYFNSDTHLNLDFEEFENTEAPAA